MYVTQLTRLKGGKPEEIVKVAKESKAIFLKHGAEDFRLTRFHTGLWTGEWLVVIRFAGWAEFGKAQEGIAKDPDFAKMFAHLQSVAELTSRNVVVGYDL